MARLNSIDIGRALAIMMMFVCHFVIYLSSPEGAYPGVFFFGDHIVGDLVAPLFLFLVGMSLYLSGNAREGAGAPGIALTKRLLKRGVVIFIIGLVFIFIVWGREEFFGWDILTTIGICILFLTPLRNMRPIYLILTGIIIVLAAPVLRDICGYPAFWEGDDYIPPFTFKETVGGFFLNGYFPFFPWVAYSIFGYTTGKLILSGNDAAAKAKRRNLMPLLSGILLIAGWGGALSNYSRLSFYPFSTSLFAIELGICLLLFWFLHVRFDCYDTTPPWMSFFNRYSRYALSAYVIHHLLIIFLPRMAGLILHGEDYFYYRKVMSSPAALASAAVFIVVFHFAIKLWDRANGKFGMEWLLKKIL